MVKMRPDQERVKSLLTDTVTLLCKNGLQFTNQLRVQGLLGITTDDNDVFVVHINEQFGEEKDSATEQKEEAQTQGPTGQGHRQRRRKRHSEDSNSQSAPGSPKTARTSEHTGIKIKKEEEDDDDDDDLMLVSCTKQDGSRMNLPNTDDRSAMRETYSELSLSDVQSGFPEIPVGGGLGDSPSKGRGPGRGPDGSPFVTGMVRNQSEDSGGSWDSSAMAGSSQWDMTQVPDGSQLAEQGGDSYPQRTGQTGNRQSRSRYSLDKKEVCLFPGCGKRFFRRDNLVRHQNDKHDRKRMLAMQGTITQPTELGFGHMIPLLPDVGQHERVQSDAEQQQHQHTQGDMEGPV